MTFEQGMDRLEEIVAKLESGDTPLEESLKLLGEGVKLTRQCGAKLQKAELTVASLGRSDAAEYTDGKSAPGTAEVDTTDEI